MTGLMMKDPVLTMSSREIAELCEKQHQHVKRDIENMLDVLKIDASSFGHIYLDSMNRKQTEYRLDKELTITLVAGYNITLRNRIIKRWMELEQQLSTAAVLPDFTDPVIAARAWADQLEKRALAEQQNALLEHKVAEQAPKAQFHDDVASSINAQTFDQVAKELRTGRIRLCRWLREQGYLMDSNEPYQRYIDQGLFRMVPRVRRDQRTGENINYSKTLITGKGLTHIYHRIQELAECIDLLAEDDALEQGQRRITRH
jgi:anti-repressor protein